MVLQNGEVAIDGPRARDVLGQDILHYPELLE